jgi:flagellar biosynthesis protein FlhB
MSESAERNHPATPLRRRQALEQGHVARSHDLISACLTLCGIAAISVLGAGLVGSLTAMLREQLGGRAWLTVDSREVAGHLVGLALGVAGALLPILAIMLSAAALLHVVQARFVLFPQREWIDPQRLHPGRVWSRILSLDSPLAALLGLAKVLAVGALAAWCGMQQHDAVVKASANDFSQLGTQLSSIVMASMVKVGGLLLALGGMDYAYRWWRHERSLRMTGEEIRSEVRGRQQAAPTRNRQRGRPTEDVQAANPAPDAVSAVR